MEENAKLNSCQYSQVEKLLNLIVANISSFTVFGKLFDLQQLEVLCDCLHYKLLVTQIHVQGLNCKVNFIIKLLQGGHIGLNYKTAQRTSTIGVVLLLYHTKFDFRFTQLRICCSHKYMSGVQGHKITSTSNCCRAAILE